ncbi:hypothetical protein L3X38_009567 [Prunus dulcis]|uniref:Bifunctional inhibitor/plant lipid transfer protein/seed storage helical domain-containing protein n=1 Tax=Prunus dulcis TaxID=3755 RepID=A0AAD4ZCH5_PRUDU|nr:hypothetical protein L3X38_009567 [Prunus dulcis]
MAAHLFAKIIISFFTLLLALEAQPAGGQCKRGGNKYIHGHLFHRERLLTGVCKRKECFALNVDVCCKELEDLDEPCRCPLLMEIVEAQRLFYNEIKFEEMPQKARKSPAFCHLALTGCPQSLLIYSL